MSADLSPPLSDRIAVRIDEAAALVGLSENAFRDHLLPACPKVYAGRAVLIPLRSFQAFIEGLALGEACETKATADELLCAVQSGR